MGVSPAAAQSAMLPLTMGRLSAPGIQGDILAQERKGDATTLLVLDGLLNTCGRHPLRWLNFSLVFYTCVHYHRGWNRMRGSGMFFGNSLFRQTSAVLQRERRRR